MRKFIPFILIILSTTSLFAQNTSRVPVEEVSLGFEMNGGPAKYGPVINYAYSTNLHLGAQIGLEYNSEADPSTLSAFRVYGQYYLSNIRNMRPFIRGNFIIADKGALGKAVGFGFTGLTVEVGGAWFPFNNLGIYGGINFLSFNADNSAFGAGLGAPFMGIQFYL